jgi:hypothetical protein
MSAVLDAVIVPDDEALAGARVGVSHTDQGGPCVLEVHGRRGATVVGVVAAEMDGVPTGKVVITESLASRAGLSEDTPVVLTAHPVTPLRQLVLEALVEDAPTELWESLRREGRLVEQCLWLENDLGSSVVEVGHRLFRVRSVDDHRAGTLRQVVTDTEVELFIPGARVGLDVVILADVSGSMQVDDLPLAQESLGWGRRSNPQYRQRIDALKDSLRQMLDARLRISGRESRVALLSFADQVHQRFPESGMVSLDAGSSTTVVDAFLDAVDRLHPRGGTNMNEGILHAAELLDLHGKTGNERLVVLVSDGKAWSPKGADSAGEMVATVDDPVSLMSHLHEERNIRLQAIGISNAEFFKEWSRRTGNDNELLRPDHPLLKELVKVGGGDPSRIGGIEVLEEYFRGLGAGLRRFVGRPAEVVRSVQLSQESREVIQLAADGHDQLKIEAQVDTLQSDLVRLNRASAKLAGTNLGPWLPFESSDKVTDILRQFKDIRVRSHYEFENILSRIHILVVECGPGRRRSQKNAMWPNELNAVYDVFLPVVNRINPLRQEYFHDKSGGKPEHQKVMAAAVQAMEHYVQTRDLAVDNAAGWGRLAQAMLDDVCDATKRAADLAEAQGGAQHNVDAGMPADDLTLTPSPGMATGPDDLDLTFDLRLRA